MYWKYNVTSLALAILFAMAFSLTVALIFISSAHTSPAPLPSVTDTSEEKGEQTAPPKPSHTLLEFTSNPNGTCTLSGVGACTDASISIPAYSPAGEPVTSIAPRAFYGCPTVVAIHIPQSVAFIGALAFADCKSLSFITVSPENLAYRAVDGVLYSADLSVLILYPPKRAGTSCLIQSATTSIREMAFYDCTYLREIRYTGSAAQWEQISIGARNYALLGLSKQFGAAEQTTPDD